MPGACERSVNGVAATSSDPTTGTDSTSRRTSLPTGVFAMRTLYPLLAAAAPVEGRWSGAGQEGSLRSRATR